jgi:hypothetical protein
LFFRARMTLFYLHHAFYLYLLNLDVITERIVHNLQHLTWTLTSELLSFVHHEFTIVLQKLSAEASAAHSLMNRVTLKSFQTIKQTIADDVEKRCSIKRVEVIEPICFSRTQYVTAGITAFTSLTIQHSAQLNLSILLKE